MDRMTLASVLEQKADELLLLVRIIRNPKWVYLPDDSIIESVKDFSSELRHLVSIA